MYIVGRERMRSLGRKAWLVTWEHVGDHAKPKRKIAAVFKPQLSGRRVLELVEFLYASLEYSPCEQMEITFGLRVNPYPAIPGTLHGVRWAGEVTCGHNPYLYGRLVDELIIPTDGQPSWKERPRPEIKALDR
jgi:hypothetical protein